MAENATPSKQDTLKRLFKENGLIAEDFFKHQHYTILTRSGIEKVQYKNNVTVHYEPVTMDMNFCVVKAIGKKPMAEGKELEIQTFGSAGHNASGECPKGKGNQYAYYPELAEKRALSRCILKICGFYELGVFGEDESDEFNPTKGEAAPVAAPVATKLQTTEEVEKGVSDKIEPVAATDPNVKYATAKQKEEIIRMLNNVVITRQEKTKFLLNINKLDEERAAQSITKLRKVIEEREEQAKAS